MSMLQERRKVLVVEDERETARLVQVNLERAGYQVVSAFDGREALRKVELERPNLIVLEATTARMDGFEVLRRLRANDETRKIPVIMLPAKARRRSA